MYKVRGGQPPRAEKKVKKKLKKPLVNKKIGLRPTARLEIDTMANVKKMTKADYFKQIMASYPLTEDEKAFVEHELELLAKKNSAEKKPTAQQVANAGVADAIYDGMEDGVMYSITDLIKTIPECADLTNQRVSAIVRGMIGTKVERIEEKRKAYFRKIAE